MKVLVTGGLGYLGSIIVPKLIERKFDVRILDSMIYGNSLTEKGHLELVQGDIRNLKLLDRVTDDVDAVIHLAGIIGDAAADLDRELTISVNYLATRQLAEICRKKSLKLIFSSTCSVYGAKPGEAVTEKSKIAPLSLYAMSKLLAEEAIRKQCKDYTVFRLGTLFGFSPRMRFDLVVNLFTAQAIQERKITVYGGPQRRPFVHLQDIAELFIKALNSGENGIYNFGGTNYQILNVAEKIKSKVECSITIFSDLKDPRDYAVDSSLAEETFGFKPARDIDFCVNEISGAYAQGIIKNYKETKFNNAEWLSRIWNQECLLQDQRES
ncbi:MAG: NAD-dependent epimerase/dehydratase family protein [Candidatus Bathyarchaeia archaeon]